MYDMHNHTNFSEDSDAKMRDVVEAAYKKGLHGIAITDHYDPDYPKGSYGFDLQFDAYHKELELMENSVSGKILLMKGLELGIQHGDTLRKCREASAGYNYDFIIGSFHCAWGKDLYVDYFEEGDVVKKYHLFYQYVLENIMAFDNFDVLGHLNIVDRYSPFIADENLFMEDIRAILKLLISRGQGIEINTSSFRYKLANATSPSEKVLKLYKKMGGEILTIGSDSHSPKNVGYMLDWATEFAKSAGFSYITHFVNREAIFTPIE